MFSHFSTSMKALGRSGPWDPETRTGNPVDCDEVRLYKKGYGRLQRSKGFEEGSAVPWEEADVFAVIDQLDQEAAEAFEEAQQLLAAGRPMAAFSPYLKGLLLDRDALACSYEWHSLQRGKEAGSLTRSDFHDPHGKAVLSRLSSLLANEPEKVKVYVSPFGIKQKPLVRVDTPLPFEVDLAVPLQYQFLPRLEQHFRLSDQAQQEYPGKQLAVQHYILRPRHLRGDLGFQDKPWSSSGIYSRVVEAAVRAGVYKGQSVHGFRRGGMQHRHTVLGESAEQVQGRALIKTPAVAARYLNPGRHHAKLAKVATKAKFQGRLADSASKRVRTVSKRMQEALESQGLLAGSDPET